MAEGRITHIARVYKNDDPKSDTWVDIERIDELNVIVDGQRINYKFDWERFESGAGTIGLGSKEKKTLVDPNDANNKIDIPVRDKHRIKFPQAVYNHYFLNDDTNKSRETHSRRIYHHAIKEGYLVGNKPPRDSKLYKRALGKQDPDQYIDVEVIDAYWTKGDDSRDIFQHILRLFFGGTFGDETVKKQKKEWSGTTDDPLIKDPIKEGDVAGGTPAFIPKKNPESGEIDPPWRLDPLQNIVNVSWVAKGDVFVSGADSHSSDSTSDLIRFLDFSKKTTDEDGEQIPKWETIGQGPFIGGEFNVGGVYGGAYGNGTFVLGGIAGAGTHGYGIIAMSKDGKSWQKVFEGEKIGDTNTADGSHVFGIVFDGTEFWAGYHESNNGEAALGEINEIDILLGGGSDGSNWGISARRIIDFYEWPTGYDHGLLAEKCPDKGLGERITIRDTNNNAVPSGIWDENETHTTLIRPTDMQSIDYLFGELGFRAGQGNTVTRITLGKDEVIEEEEIDVGFDGVQGVANAGGNVWVAVGGSSTAESAYSTDDGKTWKKLSASVASALMRTVLGKKKKA